jgi:predicted TIM-barrel fold metal-dependent hydrolase
LKLCANEKYLFPFYFIDPTEPDAASQAETAVSKGIRGFKVICSRHMPADERAMPVYEKIAALGKPIMFHSGILWDGNNASGNYNRPCNFEPLLSVPGLRFSLAHASWPWTDECIAVFGKFNSYSRHNKSAGGMLVDLTPGTPVLFREELLRKLLFTGYDVKNCILYGVDNFAGNYDAVYAKGWTETDDAIFDKFNVDADMRAHIYYKNLLRFVGE